MSPINSTQGAGGRSRLPQRSRFDEERFCAMSRTRDLLSFH